ncbi:hypothetical protein [Photobacterium lipolyticum]|uniref:hypothetical protein n=1 Tax=Photobacterium lipolyticum TaxID=266810 RepID=UPI0011B24DC0|nr:hypothetical protein [Photobacterium lipolyticum]
MAEELDRRLAELLKPAMPKNILRNAAFLAACDGFKGSLSRWGRPHIDKDNQNSLSYAHSLAAPACPNWNGEAKQLSKPEFRSFSVSENDRFGSRTGGQLQISSGSHNQVLYQIFRAPAATVEALKSTCCYIRLRGSGYERVRFGLVKLNENYEATGYIASEIIQAEMWTDEYEGWIDNVTLEMGSVYAFFVERLDVKQAQHTFIASAGVYFGVSGEIPELDTTEIDLDDQLFFKIKTGLTGAEFVENMTFPIPLMNYPHGIEKHLTVNIVETHSTDRVLSKDILIRANRDTNQLELTNVTGGSVGIGGKEFSVEAYYSKNVNTINYFNMPDYVAA